MRIKGSDLKRIIKEEIQRSTLKEQGGYSSQNLEVTANNVASAFMVKLIRFVRPGARSPIRDAITMDPTATIEFTGVVKSFRAGTSRVDRSVRKTIDAGVESGVLDPNTSYFSPVIEFEEITVGGVPMPAEVLRDFRHPNLDAGIVATAEKTVAFTGQMDLLDIEDINLIGINKVETDEARRAIEKSIRFM